MKFGTNIQKSLKQSLHVSVFTQVCFFMNFSSLKPDTENNANLTLYQANAATLTPFSKGDKILIKNLCKCKGENFRQFIIKFPDKSWTKNSINGEVKKVRNSRHVNRQFLRIIFVTFRNAISGEYYLSKTALAVIY